MKKEQFGLCDVCVLALDNREEKSVSFCTLCKAWLCASCRGRYDMRAIAMLKQKAQKLLSAVGG